MPAGVITTGTHPKALWPGVHDFWGQVYTAHAAEYNDLYEWEDSDMAYEEDVQITGFGLAPVKPQGGSITYDSEVQGPVSRYSHLAYALGYIVTYEELKFNLYEKISMRRAQANAFAVSQTIETVSAVPYNNAYSTTYFTTGDGLALISTAHANTTGGTFSNELSPSADLSEAALEDLCIQAMGLQDDRGNFISILPRSLHVPRQEWFNANRILKSVMQPDVMNNNINVLKSTNAFPEGIKMNHYFTNSSYWFVRTNCPRGMQAFWAERPNFAQDNDFDTKNAKAATYMMFSVGATDPRGILGSQ